MNYLSICQNRYEVNQGVDFVNTNVYNVNKIIPKNIFKGVSMTDQTDLGSWLKERCKNEHLSLRQVGKRASLSHSTIRTIIKGGHASAETVTKLAHAFSGDGNRKTALEDELFVLAGYRTKQEQISQPLAELLDIVNHFSTSQLKVVSAFATYLTEVSQHGQK